MPSNRYSHAMHFVEPNFLDRTGFSVGEDHGLADKLSLGLIELAEDRGRTDLRNWHERTRETASCLPAKGAQVVAVGVTNECRWNRERVPHGCLYAIIRETAVTM
jgi:hypothetical protein